MGSLGLRIPPLLNWVDLTPKGCVGGPENPGQGLGRRPWSWVQCQARLGTLETQARPSSRVPRAGKALLCRTGSEELQLPTLRLLRPRCAPQYRRAREAQLSVRAAPGALRLLAGTSGMPAPAVPPLSSALGPQSWDGQALLRATPPRPHKGRVRLGQLRSGHHSQIFNYGPTLPPTPSSASSPLINFTILNINFPPARLSWRRGDTGRVALKKGQLCGV